ncbi:excisionase family DNA-binding protein [Sphaerisporangium sp. TRM90804]|uniref:excisionase family DNA-binding protein n=1 Tax=Sphaerisporangium sp. TRM90804 TaxID=3031113 RepID=UPI00244CAF8A|nr:excisionase family DNA-binding protein [Sphaerisporangium sp. TRM90804]MDH2429778.1 excisionase family DNA-binding protein [Sphaerisporangium sp. TRM90804]
MSQKGTRAVNVAASDIGRDRLLTVEEAAERLNTSVRFPRRLIEERRIRFVHVGRFVRIPESALEDFIRAGLVEPIRSTTGRAA